jgi:hypothetical protein
LITLLSVLGKESSLNPPPFFSSRGVSNDSDGAAKIRQSS